MTNKPQARDEQMIEAIARAINNARYDYLADDYMPTEHELYVARAAHSLMAAKVAELSDDECAICGLTKARHSMSSGYGVCQIYPVFRSKREMVERLLAPHPEAQQQEDKV